MRKILITLLAITLVLCFMPVVSMAADGPVVTVGKVSGKAGDTVEVPVTLSGNTGFSDLSVQYIYDSDVLTLVETKGYEGTGVSVTLPGTLDEDYNEIPDYSKMPYNSIYTSATKNCTYNGVIITLVFEISSTASAGEYGVKVECYEGPLGNYKDGDDCNFNMKGASINLSYVNGKVTVQNDIKPEISVDKNYTLATTQKIDGVETPVIYIYGLFNEFNVASSDEFGFKLWNVKNEDAKISLPSLASADPMVVDTPVSGKAFVIKVYGKAITKGDSYGYASYIGKSISDTVNTISVN